MLPPIIKQNLHLINQALHALLPPHLPHPPRLPLPNPLRDPIPNHPPLTPTPNPPHPPRNPIPPHAPPPLPAPRPETPIPTPHPINLRRIPHVRLDLRPPIHLTVNRRIIRDSHVGIQPHAFLAA